MRVFNQPLSVRATSFKWLIFKTDGSTTSDDDDDLEITNVVKKDLGVDGRANSR